MMQMKETFWLMERHPFNPHGSFFTLGPASFFLKKGVEQKEVASPTLEFASGDRTLLSVDLPKNVSENFELKEAGLKVKNLKYFARALVAGRELIEGDETAPANPAVSFDVMDAEGNATRVIKFAYFPDFESMHGQTAQGLADIQIKFLAPQQAAAAGMGASSLSFYHWDDGHWSYEAVSKDGTRQAGLFKEGDVITPGWADMRLRVEKVLQAATVTTEIIEDTKLKKGPFAVELIVKDGEKEHVQWLVESQQMGFQSSQGVYKFALKTDAYELPFALTLNDFRKVDYPGTSNPSSFESDVTLYDGTENLTMSRTISMNKPLDYKGFRIFQSSFIQDQGKGEASVFTVAKNPGITLIYVSSFVIFVGAFIQFYGKKSVDGQEKE
jgi:hypothetical protein